MSVWIRVPELLPPTQVDSIAEAAQLYTQVTDGLPNPPLGRVSELTQIWRHGERSPRRWYLVAPGGRVCRARAGQNTFTSHSEVSYV